MEQMHVLPAKIIRAGAERLVAELSRAFEDTTDLGPRGPHIRSLELSLKTLAKVLRDEAKLLVEALDERTNDQSTLLILDKLAADVERLAQLAGPCPH